jgi:hypothetical protein
MKMAQLFVQAFSGLIAYDVLLLVGKFKAVRRLVGRWKVASRNGSSELIDPITRAVDLACICYPKQVLCLQRASVTTCLLRRYGIRAVMVLGAQKIPFKAHAWTEVEDRAVNERSDVKARYQIWERC